MIVLYTTLYNDSDPVRQQELERALAINMDNTHITRIVLLVQNIDQFSHLASDKVELFICNRKIPTYGDFLNAASREESGTNIIISNTDIAFDATVSQLEEWSYSDHLLVVSRREGFPAQSSKLTEHLMSSDAWILKTPFKTKDCPIELGRLHCESMFLGYMQRFGYTITNVSLELNAFHFHESNKRNYNPERDRYDDHGQMVYPLVGSAENAGITRVKSESCPILIDGLIFQGEDVAGIRIWSQLFAAIRESHLAEKIVVLDRGKGLSDLLGMKCIDSPCYNPHLPLESLQVVNNVCKKYKTELFIQTTAHGPSVCETVVPIYDLKSVLSGAVMYDAADKFLSLAYCKNALFFNEDTLSEYNSRYRSLSQEQHVLLPLGPPSLVPQGSPEDVLRKYGINKPYFIYTGEQAGFANSQRADLLLNALSELGLQNQFQVLFLGAMELDARFGSYSTKGNIVCAFAPDHEIPFLYSNAVAHVSTSLFKGLGMSSLEAMAYGCPVIVVAGGQVQRESWKHALVTETLNGTVLRDMIEVLQNESIRERLTSGARAYVDGLSWTTTREKFLVFLDAILKGLSL